MKSTSNLRSGFKLDETTIKRRELTSSRHNNSSNNFRSAATDSEHRQSHYGFRDTKCVSYEFNIKYNYIHTERIEIITNDDQHPKEQIRNYTDPNHAHQERVRIPASVNFRVGHCAAQHHSNRVGVVPENRSWPGILAGMTPESKPLALQL